MAKLPGISEYFATVGAPAINFGRGLLGYQDPFMTQTMQDRMTEIEAGRTKGNVGYEDYGLQTATPGGRFTGGLMDLAVNNPTDFGLAGSIGRYSFSPEGRTGLNYDFTPDQDTGSTGSAMLDFINAGGLKGAFSRMGTAQASDLPGIPSNSLERDFPGMSTGDIIDSMNNRAFIGRQITPMAKPNVVDPNRIPGRIQEAVEPQYTIRGQIADDFGEIKNKIGSGLGSIRDFFGSGINNAKEGIMNSSPMNFLRSLPTPGNLLMNIAATRNPLNPRASNYNPTLQGQVDYMKDKGMYGTNPNSGLGQITGGRLTGKNLVSGFGSNDLGEMYSKDLSKLQGYLSTMPQRFSRLRKNNPASYQKKIDNLNAKIKQNKIEAQAAQAAREAATAARAMARNPQVYANAGITSGGFASQNTGTNSNFSNRTGRGRTGYSEGGLASMFTRRG